MRATWAAKFIVCCAAQAAADGTSVSLLHNGDAVRDATGGARRGTVHAGAPHLRFAADLDRSLG